MEEMLVVAAESCQSVVVHVGSQADLAVAAVDVHLGVEACATQGARDCCSSLWLDESTLISILLVLNVRAEVDARHCAKKEEVESDDQVADHQNDKHGDVQPGCIIVIGAIIRV